MGLRALLEAYAAQGKLEGLDVKIKKVTEDKSVKDLYLAYSVLYRDFDTAIPASYGESGSGEMDYLKRHKANILDIARIYFLSSVLEADPEFFINKVANIIQVADTRELETFLRYLYLLPEAQSFNVTAVEALRTNIAPCSMPFLWIIPTRQNTSTTSNGTRCILRLLLWSAIFQ